MKAMIFAAGIGTRLRPYTQSMPKALVPVAGVPMLEILLTRLRENGIHDIIINVHHFANQVIDFLNRHNSFGVNIAISHEEELLLDTGGGLKKASWFFDDPRPFLVQNVDVLCDVEYKDMIDLHMKSNTLATLAVCKRETSRYFLFDDRMQLCGWENTKTADRKIARSEKTGLTRFAFSGIHIIDPVVFNFMEEGVKFSIINTYLELAANQKIIGFEHDPENWVDMGKPEELIKAESILKKMKSVQ